MLLNDLYVSFFILEQVIFPCCFKNYKKYVSSQLVLNLAFAQAVDLNGTVGEDKMHTL